MRVSSNQSRVLDTTTTVAACGAAIVVLAGCSLCITDLNHPPGVRSVRAIAFAVIVFLGFLEFLRPWWGFIASTFVWSHWLVFRELGKKFNPLFAYFPDFQGGLLFSMLGCCVCLRVLRQPPSTSLSRSTKPEVWENVLAVSFSCILLAALTSIIAFYIRYNLNTLHGWTIDPPQLRHLLSSSLLGLSRPALGMLELFPYSLTGIILIQLWRRGQVDVPVSKLALSMIFCGIIVAIEASIQIYKGPELWKWPFDGGPPGGPFYTRTLLAPVLICFASVGVATALSLRLSRFYAGLLFSIAILLSTVAILTTTRNAILGVVAMGWLSLFWRPGRYRVIIAGMSIVILLLIVFIVPLPDRRESQPHAVRRVLETITHIRNEDWFNAFSYRGKVYSTSLEIWTTYPITGSGFNTMFMQVQPTGPFPESVRETGVPQVHSHNTPLHFLCEMGPIAALAWLAIFILFPATILRKSTNGRYFAWALLIMGILHQFDHIWILPGLPGFMILVIMITLELNRELQSDSLTVKASLDSKAVSVA